MRVGIDAKWFFEGPPSGRIVVRALVRELLGLSGGHEWVIFTDAAATEPFPYTWDGVSVVPVWARNNLLSNVAVVPRQADRLGVDVTFYQNFAPPWGRGRKVAMVHDILFESHPEYYTRTERLYFAPLKFLAQRADRLCTVSAAERERMVRHGYGTADRIDVVHHGVDGLFRPRERHDPGVLREMSAALELPERFILFVGRLNTRKNVAGLLHALTRMERRDVPCLVVGAPDWKSDDTPALARELGLGNRVRFLGPRAGRELAALFALAAVFCFPSHEESFGLPPLEAMASGAPVVVSDLACLREVCGDAALFVQPDDHASIAAALDRVLSDAALEGDLRARGPARAAQFTWRRAAERTLACLERAVAS